MGHTQHNPMLFLFFTYICTISTLYILSSHTYVHYLICLLLILGTFLFFFSFLISPLDSKTLCNFDPLFYWTILAYFLFFFIIILLSNLYRVHIIYWFEIQSNNRIEYYLKLKTQQKKCQSLKPLLEISFALING